MKKIKLVCFDIDGTLVRGISWLMLAEALGCPAKKHVEVYERVKRGDISVREGGKMLVEMYRRGDNANRRFIIKTLWNITPRPEAKPLISYLTKKGYRVCLISGAIDIFVESIARKLGVQEACVQVSLEFDANSELIKINWTRDQGKTKLAQLKKLARELHLDMRRDVIFVGDSDNDVEVFKATGHGIAVHCRSKKLRRVAWREVKSLKEIRKLL